MDQIKVTEYQAKIVDVLEAIEIAKNKIVDNPYNLSDADLASYKEEIFGAYNVLKTDIFDQFEGYFDKLAQAKDAILKAMQPSFGNQKEIFHNPDGSTTVLYGHYVDKEVFNRDAFVKAANLNVPVHIDPGFEDCVGIGTARSNKAAIKKHFDKGDFGNAQIFIPVREFQTNIYSYEKLLDEEEQKQEQDIK